MWKGDSSRRVERLLVLGPATSPDEPFDEPVFLVRRRLRMRAVDSSSLTSTVQ
jgi:hypothetical protein